MTDLSEQLTQEIELIFADWGQPATLDEVIQFFDATSGEIEESISSNAVTVIRGSERGFPLRATAAIPPDGSLNFLLKTSDVESNIVCGSSRIRIESQTFIITEMIASHFPGLTALSCQLDTTD